jgi:hypothetical protein
MSNVRRISLAVVLTGAVIAIAALQQAAGLSMPGWAWALAGWTGLSFVLGLLIGRWLKPFPLTEDEAGLVSRFQEQVSTSRLSMPAGLLKSDRSGRAWFEGMV